ncbi:MAG: hypothetical protein ACI9J2_001176 [Saprospiraceae bacterium]|jgi:hypothetical protein
MTSTDRRRFLTNTLSAAALGSAGLANTARAQSNHNYGIEGQIAPELKVPYWIDAQGEQTEFNLKEQRGKFVFIKCWQAWCPGCHSRGFPTLQEITHAFLDEPLVETLAIQTTFEGFGSNTQDKVREMQLRYDLPILMGHDDGQLNAHHRPNTMMDYRTGGTPWLVLIAPDGSVIFNDYHLNTDQAIQYLKGQVAALKA